MCEKAVQEKEAVMEVMSTIPRWTWPSHPLRVQPINSASGSGMILGGLLNYRSL